MATLVLSAAGRVLAGPIGGAIGALVGQQVDARLFAPKPRQGPRLGDLTVQTSSYATAIPKIFGTMRVAGTVAWSTDLQETATTRGGKGQPKRTEYSYSASFAVVLSGRPIGTVRRIWADGKLLRGAGGDFKSDTGYRLYPGNEDQAVDPLIAAAEGLGQAPAFRGLAYAMFEDLQLADYGNRIPSLTFEVEADAGAVPIGFIAEELGSGILAAGETPTLIGYAASGASVRAAIETLADVEPLSIRDDGIRLTVSTRREAPIEIPASDAQARGAGGGGGSNEFCRRSADRVPSEVSIAYHDPARDYQIGLQRAARHGPTVLSEPLALPAALGAGTAKALAGRRLAALWTGRTTGKLHLGWKRGDVRPGSILRVEGEAGLWRVARSTVDRMVVSLELVRIHSGQVVDTASASEGRPIGHPDLLHGPTTLQLLDLPVSGEGPAERPYLLVAAAGVEAGWRRATLSASYDGGASWRDAGPTAAPATMGVALAELGAAGSALFDAAGAVEVELLNDTMWLEGRSDEALVGGANLALLGEEVIQFGVAEPVGGKRFRLSRLLRGRRGTEWAAEIHRVGEPFVLLEPAALAVVEPPLALVGSEVRLSATGLGDTEPVVASRILTGEAVRPPAPVHLKAEWGRDGDLAISWTRRSRAGWTWLSGTDTPLGEEREEYDLVLSGAGFERTVSATEPRYLYPAAAQLADGAVGDIFVSLRQLGTFAPSRAVELVVPAQS